MKNFLQAIINFAGFHVSKNMPWSAPNPWFRSIQVKSILDVGANEGQFARKIAQLLPEAKIWCFEPIPSVQKKLIDNIKKLNASMVPFACGSKDESASINVSRFSPSSSLLKMTSRHTNTFKSTETTGIETIQIRKLDTVVESENIPGPFLIKIDTQGFDLLVLMGAERTLTQSNCVLIEINFADLYEGQPTFEEIHEFLRIRGFRFFGMLASQSDPETGQVMFGDAIFLRKSSV